MVQVFRIRDNGEKYLPHPDRSGQFVLADPVHGSQKHHAKNQIKVATIEEAIRLIETRGFSLRMRGESSEQINLISPGEIQIIR